MTQRARNLEYLSTVGVPELRRILSAKCGVISHVTGKMCTKTHNWYIFHPSPSSHSLFTTTRRSIFIQVPNTLINNEELCDFNFLERYDDDNDDDDDDDEWMMMMMMMMMMKDGDKMIMTRWWWWQLQRTLWLIFRKNGLLEKRRI